MTEANNKILKKFISLKNEKQRSKGNLKKYLRLADQMEVLMDLMK